MTRRHGSLAVVLDGIAGRWARSRASLKVLAAVPAEVPFLHWGDADAGGLRIFPYLEENLPRGPRPHLMNKELAEKSGSRQMRVLACNRSRDPTARFASRRSGWRSDPASDTWNKRQSIQARWGHSLLHLERDSGNKTRKVNGIAAIKRWKRGSGPSIALAAEHNAWDVPKVV